ncbi:hypothetical protein CSCA_3299 [Clostridium scatologenes]|uniref:Uncharacterized protein n=1 Tax=Clostridium scatologenes TaxID=1548 RepID=A0A0E3K224_CLOSL|nr:hypothetical protein CSCA_3299 [Clostridium scatologenes]
MNSTVVYLKCLKCYPCFGGMSILMIYQRKAKNFLLNNAANVIKLFGKQ